MARLDDRITRLAGYTAMVAAGNHAMADIQTYEGPPIPLDGSSIELSLAGIEFSLMHSIHENTQQGGWSSQQCCGYGETEFGGYSCTWPGTNRYSSRQSFFQLEVACSSNMDGIRFLPFDAPVQADGCFDQTEACFRTAWQNDSCFGGSAGSSDNCNDSYEYHLGFRVVSRTAEDFRMHDGWMTIEGPLHDLKITRWAFEDGGGPINVGEEPPTDCPADLDGDGTVDSADLGLLIAAWNTKGSPADLDGSGRVDAADLGLLIGAWGLCP